MTVEKIKNIGLSQLVDPPRTNSISGREFGEQFAEKVKLIDLLKDGYTVNFNINDDIVKAINDSFIKGLFSLVFKEYKTITEVQKHIKIVASTYYQKLFLKNWKILEAIYNV